MTFFRSMLASVVIAAQAQAGVAPIAGHDIVSGKALEFKLDDVNRATVLIFVSAKCPCSISHEDQMRNLQSEFGPKGFRFVGIHSNQDEEVDITQSHFRAIDPLGFPVLEDKGAKIADRYGSLKTPHVFIVSKAGEVLYQGGINDSARPASAKRFYLKEALTSLADGKNPEMKITRTLGCRISRSE